jgi:PBP4 family serine-type D-alanyl-D-alanine carboxypeptidase
MVSMTRRNRSTFPILALVALATIGGLPLAATAQPAPALSSADSARALGNLATDIEKLVTLAPELKLGKVGVYVTSLSTDRLIYALNGDKPLTPASTTKVVTTFTALTELGTDYVVTTDIGIANKPKDGILVGDVYVRGHGDPYLLLSDIDALVTQMAAFGIKEIHGNVVGDGTFFDDKLDRTEYSGDEDEVENLPPISALTVEQNMYSVIVSSSRTPGQPLNVQTYPRSSAFEIVNSGVSVGGGRPAGRGRAGRGRRHSGLLPSGRSTRPVVDEADDIYNRVGDEPLLAYNRPATRKKGTAAKPATAAPRGRRVAAKVTPRKGRAAVAAPKHGAPLHTVRERGAEPAPAVRSSAGPLKVSVTGDRTGKQVITVTGGLAANRTVSYHYEMKNPPLIIAGIVYDRLRGSGITITGQPVTGSSPRQVKVVGEIRRPLVDILQNVMKHSNNYLAEYTFKMIGANAGGHEETAKRSIEVIDRRMDKAKVPFGACIINDGSGLSRANCLSTRALAGMLTAAYHDEKVFKTLYPLMSIAGVDGTLRKRMKGTYAEGNVHGKTGTLRNASALTGYVTSRDGELFCFAMLMNGGRIGEYHVVQDKIAERLAAFTYYEGGK